MKPGLAFAFLSVALAGCASGPPVVSVGEHPEAWAVWEEARSAGDVASGATLLHLDAHEDLGTPELSEPLPAVPPGEEAWRIARSELSVDDVVVPALLTGIVSRLVWVVPAWLAEEPSRELRRQVGSVDGLRREFATGPELAATDFPDRREFVTRIVRLGELEVTAAGCVLLDIDLDYFACENPHAAHLDREISRAEYESLIAGGEVWMEGEVVEGGEATRSVVLRRPPGRFSWPVRLDRVRSLATGTERYVKGCVCMGLYRDAFPAHRPSDGEIVASIAALETWLARSGLRPAIVTIARSADSGFVPPDRVDFVERSLLDALRRVWPGLRLVRR